MVSRFFSPLFSTDPSLPSDLHCCDSVEPESLYKCKFNLLNQRDLGVEAFRYIPFLFK